MTNPETAADRIRAYLRLLPNARTLGGEIAYSEEFRSEDWPRSCYAPTREDVEALLAAAPAVVSSPPATDRATVLREAADALGRMDYDTDSNDYGYDTYRDAWNGGVMDGAGLLRRMADEAQPEPGALAAAECSAQNRNYESGPRLCIRAAQHRGDHIDERGFHWSDAVAVYPVADGTFRAGVRPQAVGARQPDTETPRRGDQFDTWLKAQRDLCEGHASTWNVVDGLLDQYRLHADTGTPLDGHVCEGRVIGDCECLEQPAGGAGGVADETGEGVVPHTMLGAAEIETRPDFNVTPLTGDAFNADEEIDHG